MCPGKLRYLKVLVVGDADLEEQLGCVGAALLLREREVRQPELAGVVHPLAGARPLGLPRRLYPRPADTQKIMF